MVILLRVVAWICLGLGLLLGLYQLVLPNPLVPKLLATVLAVAIGAILWGIIGLLSNALEPKKPS